MPKYSLQKNDFPTGYIFRENNELNISRVRENLEKIFHFLLTSNGNCSMKLSIACSLSANVIIQIKMFIRVGKLPYCMVEVVLSHVVAGLVLSSIT